MLLKGFTYVFLLLTILLSVAAIRRARLSYNEAGRYFDAEAMVVYDRNTVVAYSFFAIMSGLVFLLLLTWQRTRRKKRDRRA